MPNWSELVKEMLDTPQEEKDNWLRNYVTGTITKISKQRNDSNVLLYASAFLQKPQAPPFNIMITLEDLNGFMTNLHGMDFTKPLTLILHTPGGVTNAAETIVSYLREMFEQIEVIVPTIAMSAGTMIALSADLVLMGKQSQLGPIDPQIPFNNGSSISARAVVEQFLQGRLEILGNPAQDIPGNPQAVNVWGPILASLGPSLLTQAKQSLQYSEQMVTNWLRKYMLKDSPKLAEDTAAYFADATKHNDHGRRIDRAEARANNIAIEDFDGPGKQDLQEAILTLYHLVTLTFEQTRATKLIAKNGVDQWVKNW